MPFNAGRIVTAADLAFKADSLILPDGDPLTAVGAWEDWGGTLTFPNPDASVAVIAWATGQGTKSGGALVQTFVSLRVRISFTGGSTWGDGPGPRQDVEGPGGNISRGALAAQHFLAGTPTGDIVVRVQHQGDAVAPNVQFYGGTLTVLVIPMAV